MKQYVFLALLCFASSLLGSAATVAFLPESPAPEIPSAETQEFTLPTELQLTKLVIIDAKGEPRIELAANLIPGETGPALAFYDSFGVRKMTAGILATEQPQLTMENSLLPDPEHKRIALTLTDTQARLELGHGEVSEIVLQSARPADTSENRIELRARNSSTAAVYVDDFGRATVEITDAATKSVLRVPELRTSLLD